MDAARPSLRNKAALSNSSGIGSVDGELFTL